MKTIRIILGLFLIGSLFSCDSQKNPHITPKTASLHQFKSCDALEKARTYKVENQVYTSGGTTPLSAEDSGTKTNSETNNQVAGVDEMDTSKASGNFLYHLDNNNYNDEEYSLIVLKRLPTNDAAVVQTINLGEGYAQGIFITSNKAVILLASYDYSESQTRILTYDRNSNGTLSNRIERKVDGYLNTARLIDTQLHLVVDRYLETISEDAKDETTPIEDSLPRVYKNGVKKSTASCKNIWREDAIEEEANEGFGLINNLAGVLSFNIDDDASIPEGEWIAGNSSGTIYSSIKNIFLGSYGWYEGTPIHQFKLGTDTTATKYIGTVLVGGFPINQFAMDEYDGFFRIAVTEVPPFETENCAADDCVTTSIGAPSAQSSSIYTFKLTSSNPDLAGSLKGLGVTEQIYAVRFMEDRAFVVTFRQTDPLYAIDLSNQNNPVLKGELKIPGFSNYLHPIDNDHLIGIGQSATNEGVINGMALSLFDVSDLSNPKLLKNLKIGSSGTQSEAQYDHHAFRYIPETEQLVIPVNVVNSNYATTFSGFQIYDVSVSQGFDLVGQSSFGSGFEYYYDNGSRAFYKDGAITMLGGGKMVIRNSSSPSTNVASIDLN